MPVNRNEADTGRGGFETRPYVNGADIEHGFNLNILKNQQIGLASLGAAQFHPDSINDVFRQAQCLGNLSNSILCSRSVAA